MNSIGNSETSFRKNQNLTFSLTASNTQSNKFSFASLTAKDDRHAIIKIGN